MQQARKVKGKALIITGASPKTAKKSWRAAGNASRRKTGPTRQCVVCRKVGPTWELLQLMAVVPAAPPAATCKSRGRRAYVCIAFTCLRNSGARGCATASGGLPQANLTPTALLAALQDTAALRLREILGLARRQGAVVLGAGRLSETPAHALHVVMTPTDVAERTARQLVREGHRGVVVPFLTAVSLGQAMGAAPVAAVGFRPGRLATQAAYWLRVWYEAQSEGSLGMPSASASIAQPMHQSAKQIDDTSGTDETRTRRRIEVAR